MIDLRIRINGHDHDARQASTTRHLELRVDTFRDRPIQVSVACNCTQQSPRGAWAATPEASRRTERRRG
ncbi:predicted protein [Streptomyces viridosporus ATCC 14672]|uniref:Predicted protein n=1 Tax=Streptomyces viridosporus (strain ATCC 14672 / DSM 40746 / JCM 4963 / KCTC 9882 / NRRL B-12104 / FH 1290) TaxID=566461 RepID=D6A350_STRV1|nr:predicted protein [Streptomyces viridosporus ATCC 14672]